MATGGKAYGSVQILPWQTDCIIVHIGGLAPAIQVEAVVIEPGGKNRAMDHSVHSVWFGTALIACPTMTFSHLECVGLESVASWRARSGFSIVGQRA